MVYTGQPSKGCATCRKRRVKCDEQLPQCSGCLRINQQCPGYKNHFDLAWRDQTAVAKKGVERGKAKRKAAREREQAPKPDSVPLHAPVAQYSQSSSSGSSRTSASPNPTFTPPRSHGSQRSSVSSHDEDDSVEDASTIIIKYSTTKPLDTDPYLTLLRPIPEEQALCFFFNNFVLPIRDPLARKGFLEHLGPFYANAGSQSALKMSTMAVATCMMSTGMGRPPDSALARSFYLRAVCRLQERVSQQDNCSSDELIIAVMLLQFYEASVGHLTKRTTNPHPHLDGALALIRHRGPQSFQNPISRSILFYIRGLLIDEAFRSASPLPHDVVYWESIMPESEKLPGIRLDSINLDLANLQAAAFSAINGPQTKYRDPLLRQLIREATEIDKRFVKWPDSVPESWLPLRLSGKDHIHPTLQLYQDCCDVYKSLFIAGLWNKLRLSQIELRFTIISIFNNLPHTLANSKRQQGCHTSMQELADDICASVPYFIGDRIKPGRAGEPGIHYPRIPGQPPIMDHYKSGPALGGWSLLAPLGTLMRTKVHLRDGQREWIAGQMARTARIYNIGLSSMKKG